MRQAVSSPATERPLCVCVYVCVLCVCVYCVSQHSGGAHSPINTHMQRYMQKQLIRANGGCRSPVLLGCVEQRQCSNGLAYTSASCDT